MLRKLILSAVLATSSGLGLTAGTASADPPFHGPGYGHGHSHRYDRRVRFEVEVRHRDHWDHYATFRDRDDAERAARQLRRQGYIVRIDRERGW